MKSRNHKARHQATTRRLRSSLLSAASATGLALMLVSSHAAQVQAQQPLKDAIFEPANRVARFLGIGYSDGYHASQSRSNCALLDLPPASAYTAQTAQHSYGHGQALFSMPASAYTFGTPAWTGSSGHHHAYTVAPEIHSQPTPYTNYHNTQQFNSPAPAAVPIPAAGSIKSYPVQPSLPPSPNSSHATPAYPTNPTYNPSLQPVAPQTTAPSPTTQPRQLDTQSPRSQNNLDFEDLPAPRPTSGRTSPSEASPSDLPSDPPSGRFFEEDQTQRLLEGLESLGEETLEDPLLQDAPSPGSLPAAADDSALLNADPESLLQESTNDSTGGSLNDSLEDLDLDLDLDGLSLPPASGDADALLNTQMRTNPFNPDSSYQSIPATPNHWPQQALHPRLSAPAQQSQNQQRLTEPVTIGAIPTDPEIVKPAVTRLPTSNTTRTPRTARTIYEPRR